jgi:hypothetical protein
MNAISGHDLRDSTSLDAPVPDYTKNLGRDLKGIRIGLPKEYMIEGLDPVVKTAVMASIEQLKALGAEIAEVSLPHTDYAVGVYYILATAEASANLARFDGVRYGHRADNIANLFDHYSRTREEGFGAEVKRRIILGTYVLSSGYYNAYYLHAQKVRELIRRDFAKAFESGRYFHDRSKPRWDLRNQCPLRVCRLRERNKVADWIAATRKSARRGTNPSNCACLRTKHRLAQGPGTNIIADALMTRLGKAAM